MSQRRVLRIAIHILTMATIFWVWADRAQAIRYELVNGGGGNQGGYTLQGFIEFDSPCRTSCTAANVIDFTFSVSGPSNYSYSYQSPSDVVLTWPGMGGGGGIQEFVDAGPISLSVNYGVSGTFQLIDSSAGRPTVTWAKFFSPYYSSTGPGLSGGWQSGGEKPPVATVIGNVVPEPATVATVFWGSVVSFLVARNRELGFTKNEGVANHVSY